MSNSFQIGGIDNLSFDIDADGEYLYIATLNSSGFPEILKLSTALNQDATSEYAPGTGSEINVKCGNLESEKVWAVGDFGTFGVVELSGNVGVYWLNDSESDSWILPAGPFFIGPDDDDFLTIFTEDSKVFQSYFLGDLGPYWIQMGTTGIRVRSVDILDINPDEILIGNTYFYGDPTESVKYSPNSGQQWEDVTFSLPLLRVTSVLWL